MCICEELINALSLLAVVSLVVTGWVASSCHLPFPTSHISSRCQRLITVCSVLKITKRSSVFFHTLLCILLFSYLAAVSPILWRQIVICSFASLTPHHMAPENWKWKLWKWMLLPSSHHSPNPPSSHSAGNTNTFQKWMLGLSGSHTKPSPPFIQISIRSFFSVLLVLR